MSRRRMTISRWRPRGLNGNAVRALVGSKSEAVPATVSGERGLHRGSEFSGPQPLGPERSWEGACRVTTREPGDRPARVALAGAQGMAKARNLRLSDEPKAAGAASV